MHNTLMLHRICGRGWMQTKCVRGLQLHRRFLVQQGLCMHSERELHRRRYRAYKKVYWPRRCHRYWDYSWINNSLSIVDQFNDYTFLSIFVARKKTHFVLSFDPKFWFLTSSPVYLCPFNEFVSFGYRWSKRFDCFVQIIHTWISICVETLTSRILIKCIIQSASSIQHIQR